MFSKHNKILHTHTRTLIYIDIQPRIREVVATLFHHPRIRRMMNRCFVVARRVAAAVVDTHIRIQASNTSISSHPHHLCSKNMGRDLIRIRIRLRVTLHHNTLWIPMAVITIPMVSSSPNNNHLIISIRSMPRWSLEDPRAHNLIITSIRILMLSKVTNSDIRRIVKPAPSLLPFLFPRLYIAIRFGQSWTCYLISVLQPQIRAPLFHPFHYLMPHAFSWT